METIFKIPESVLVVIYTANLDVLLIERADKAGFWQSVTGSKDTLAESLDGTAAREVHEETGIIVEGFLAVLQSNKERRELAGLTVPATALCDWKLSNVYDIYPVWRHRYAPGITRNTEHVFGLRVPRDIPITLAPREHVNHLWLPYWEAADKCFSPSNAEAILQLPRHTG